MALIEELIEKTPGQLIQFVHFTKVHEKRCIDSGLDPMYTRSLYTQPNETEIHSHADLKALLADDYDYISNRLLAKYQAKKSDYDDWKALLEEYLAVIEGDE